MSNGVSTAVRTQVPLMFGIRFQMSTRRRPVLQGR